MRDKIKNTLKNPTIKKIAGFVFVIAGLIFMVIPIVPGVWLLVVGLELLGLRLLLQDKLKCRFRNHWVYKKLVEVKEKIFK